MSDIDGIILQKIKIDGIFEISTTEKESFILSPVDYAFLSEMPLSAKRTRAGMLLSYDCETDTVLRKA